MTWSHALSTDGSTFKYLIHQGNANLEFIFKSCRSISLNILRYFMTLSISQYIFFTKLHFLFLRIDPLKIVRLEK